MNQTLSTSPMEDMYGYYIVCSISAVCAILAIVMSIIIVSLVIHVKRRLHTERHLLMCNTAVASSFYCISQLTSYVVLIFFPQITDDVSCRWRGYLSYASICGATYSYLIQAVSRLFFTVFATKHPWMVSFKMHRLLIFIHWLVCFTLPLSTLITDDIYFRPGLLCWVPLSRFIHAVYSIMISYVLPIIAIAILYIYIYRMIKNVEKRREFLRNTTHEKRDLEVLRNIVIFLGIYIVGGTPSLIYLVSSVEIFYLTGIATVTLAVFMEKIVTIILDRELRSVVKGLIYSRHQITPLDHSMTRPGNHINIIRLPKA